MTKYHGTRLQSITKTFFTIIKNDLALLDNYDLFRVIAKRDLKFLNDLSKCPCCDADLEIKQIQIDIFSAVLLSQIGYYFLDSYRKTKNFSESNKMLINNLLTAKLKPKLKYLLKFGLLVEIKDKKYSITQKGFHFLAGFKINKYIYLFRDQILKPETQKMTSLEGIFRRNDSNITKGLKRAYKPNIDYKDHNINDFKEFILVVIKD